MSFEGFFNHENDGNACGRPRVNKVFIIVVVLICSFALVSLFRKKNKSTNVLIYVKYL